MSVEMFKQGMELFADQWQAPGGINLYASGDLDDYLTLTTVSNVVTLTATGSSFNFVGAAEFDGITLGGAITGGSQNITGLGTINGLAITANTGAVTSGSWTATVISPVYGGTGVANNVASTLTITGAYTLALTIGANTGVTLPASGTLATLAGAETFTAKVSYNGLVVTANTGVITTGTWNGTTIAVANGGTGVTASTGTVAVVLSTSPTLVTPILGIATATSINKITITQPATGATLTLVEGSSLITAGAYATTLTATAATNVTLPTTGTLATLAGTEELDNKTLDSSVGKGTWTASGTWTLPALTLGGAIAGGTQAISNLGSLNLTNTASPGVAVLTITGSETLASANYRQNIQVTPSYIVTGAAYTNDCRCLIFNPNIGAGNTQNWTANPSLRVILSYPALVTPTSGSYTVAQWRGYEGYVTVGTSTTLTLWYAIYIGNPSASGTLTTNNAIYIADQTAGTSDYGLNIAGADTCAIWLCSGSDGTDAANGITFGSSKDTNLYRSAANSLKTDDAFSALSYAVGANAGTDDTGSGTITTFTITIEKGIVTAFAKVS